MARRYQYILLPLLLATFLVDSSFAAERQKSVRTNTIQAATAYDVYVPFLINNVFNYYANNGDGSYNRYSTDNEGFEFAKGTGKHIIFEDGIMWGGYHEGRAIPKVGGSCYRHGLEAGPILTYGTATTNPVPADSGSPAYRVYRVRPDISPSVPAVDAQIILQQDEVPLINRYQSFTAKQLYDQYIQDWNEWPAALGAPYKDIDGNGKYDPAVDIPGVPDADQTLWYVANDLDSMRVFNLTGSPSIGLEMQRTVWGYRRAGALGNTIFVSTVIINKSGAPVDSMFLAQFSDPDLGDGGDDLIGCDTTLSLGYVYNGAPNDPTYGTAVPAGGYSILHGPVVASAADTAFFLMHPKPGFRNLPMTRFTWFTSGSVAYADPRQGQGGDREWWRLMIGFTPKADTPFVDPTRGNSPAQYVFYGDPVTGTGWIDGTFGLRPADRRLVLVSGPFTMAAGDTQQIVIANLAGLGADRLSSITVMKSTCRVIRQFAGQGFAIPTPPPPPELIASPLDGQVILTWGTPESKQRVEGASPQGYRFEGYNIYELPGPVFRDPIRIATYDLMDGVKTILDTVYDFKLGVYLTKVQAQGTDSGILSTLVVDSSRIARHRLVNGSKYYFAVTAYYYNPTPPAGGEGHTLETAPQIVTVVPQSPNPGTRYAAAIGDTVHVTQIVAPGGYAADGQVLVFVEDPTKLTGHTYNVTFQTDTANNATWSIRDSTTGNVLTSGQTNLSGDSNYPVVDGLSVHVYGPPPGMRDYAIVGTRHWSWTDANGWNLEGFYGAIGNAYANWFSSSTVTYDKLRNVTIKYATADGTWDPKVQPADPNFSRGYRYLRDANQPAAQPGFAPWIVNTGTGYAYQDYNWGVPFSAWNMETTPPTRLAVGHLENNQAQGLVDGKYWPPVYGSGVDNVTITREFFFIFDAPYTDTPDPAFQVDIQKQTVAMMWMGTPNRKVGAENFKSGDEFAILANHMFTSATRYTFTAPLNILADAAIAKDDVKLLNVFPNPYSIFNVQDASSSAQFVTFTHLPRKAVLRVFTLAGILVRTLAKDDPGQFLQWNLLNERGSRVGSGMYVIHVTMPELGVTKVLKLGVVTGD